MVKAKNLITFISTGLITGFIIGLGKFFNEIIANQYIQYKMFRITIHSLPHFLNKWVLLLAVYTIVIIALYIIIWPLFVRLSRIVWELLFSGAVNVNINDRDRFMRANVIIFCFVLFLSGGWAINHYWLPGKFDLMSLIFDGVFLLFTLFLGWILIKINWLDLFNILIEKKYILKLAFILIIFLFVSNIYPLIDSKINTPNGPNVIIISVDTLRADHLGCYGYNRNTSPNIDKLAKEGHLFRKAYTSMPTTLPAHASLFSSLYPRQLGIRRNGEKVPQGSTMLAEIFKDNGYETAAFVSSQVMDKRYGLDQGFKQYKLIEGQNADPSQAIGWLKRHYDDPFFLFVHLFDPHTPYYASKSFQKMFNVPNKRLPVDKEFLSNVEELTPELIQDTIFAYDACIAEADSAVGQILSELKRLKVFDNTLIVIVADHGETLDELIARYGYAFDHGEFLYAHQLHIPLIFLLPEKESYKNGVIHDLPVSIVDVLPTILEILDIEPVSSMAGRSFLPVLKGEKLSNQPIYSERRQFKIDRGNPIIKGESFSIINGGWHFITSTQGQELYNMANDIREIHTINNTEVLTNMNNQLQNYLNLFKPMYGPSVIVEENIEKLRSLGYIE